MEATFIWFILGNISANYFPKLLSFNEIIIVAVITLLSVIYKKIKIAAYLVGFIAVFITAYTNQILPQKPLNMAQDLNISGEIITPLIQQNKRQKNNSPEQKYQPVQPIRFDIKVNCIKQATTPKQNLCNTLQNRSTLKSFHQSIDNHGIDNHAIDNNSAPRINSLIVRLSWRAPQIHSLQQGDKIAATVRLKLPNGFHNQAGFDYQKWLFSQSYFATGYIKQAHLLDKSPTVQSHILNQFSQHYQTYPTQGLILGLLMGNRDLMTPDNWDVLAKTGTSHLLAISGLHIGIVFGWLWLVFKIIFRLLALGINRNLESISLISALVFTWGFVWLSGMALPSVRAAILLSVFVIGALIQFKTSWRLRYLIATLFVLLIDPMASLSISFWLSFYAAACVLILVWFLNQWLRIKNKFINYCVYFALLQAGLTLLLLPLQIIIFGHLSTISFFANMVAIPVVSFVVLPAVLISGASFYVYLPMSVVLADLSNYVLVNLIQFLTVLANLKFAYVPVSQSHLGFGLFLAVFVLMIYMLRRLKLGLIMSLSIKILCVLSYLPLVFVFIPESKWQIDVLDVGQGLAVLISKDGEAVLYDTGNAFESGFNLFEAVVEPVINAKGLTLKAVLISHDDKDHAGGLAFIQQNYPHVQLWQPQAACKGIEKSNLLNLKWQQLWPAANSKTSTLKKWSDNNRSCVIRVSGQGHSVLLTGDIEKVVEQQLIQFSNDTRSAQSILKSDVLIAPHHGSKTSSSLPFLQHVKPEYAVISAGLNNRFKHPHSDVVKRFSEQNIALFNTAHQGQITFTFHHNKAIKWTTNQSSFFLPWHSRVFYLP